MGRRYCILVGLDGIFTSSGRIVEIHSGHEDVMAM
jgi:hypothetical protein